MLVGDRTLHVTIDGRRRDGYTSRGTGGNPAHIMAQRITVETMVAAPIEEVWRAWTTPEDIKQWNAASDDWHTTSATVDLREGGAFSSRMEAKDGSFGFDFAGTYTKIVPHQVIEMSFGDRTAIVEFVQKNEGVLVRETFDAEETHSVEQQQAGWQAILDRFGRHVGRGASR
jgi:uncharacterized protein YndB with AHSA1/START domain